MSGLGATLANLAGTYRWANRWEDAMRVATEAYEMSRAELGEEHAITAGSKGHLAQVVHGMGDLEHAISLYREALPVLERTLGRQHANTLSNWNNLGIVLAQAGDLEGAEQVHRRILDIRLERYGTERHREVAASYQNLAALLVQLDRLTEGDSLAQRAEMIFRSERGDDHYSVAFSLITQTEAQLQQGRGNKAEGTIRRAIRILEPQFGTAYPTAAATCRLGRALALQGRVDRAQQIATAALETMEETTGVSERELHLCRAAVTELRTAGGS